MPIHKVFFKLQHRQLRISQHCITAEGCTRTRHNLHILDHNFSHPWGFWAWHCALNVVSVRQQWVNPLHQWLFHHDSILNIPEFPFCNVLCTVVHCNALKQYKPTKCKFYKLIFRINFRCLLHVSNLVSSSLGTQLYMQYGMLYMHQW